MGGFGGLLDGLARDLSAHPTLLESVVAILASFVFGQILAWSYERTYRGLSYSTNVTHSIILSSMSAALVILAMKHSIVAGLGLLAALSMVRFRTTLKAPKDLVFVMAAITLGIASGANALIPASVGCVSFSIVAMYLHMNPFGSRARFDGVLRFRTAPATVLEPSLTKVLDDHCRRYVRLNIGEVAQGSLIEHAYHVKLWKDAKLDNLLADLRNKLSTSDARVLLQEATAEF